MALSKKEWHAFKTLKTNALERHCASILTESAALCANTEQSSHERYLILYKLINEHHRAMIEAFDGHELAQRWYTTV